MVILKDDQALSGWLARTSHLTDPLLYVVYHRNPSDPAWPDSPIPGNCPFFDQSALLPEAPDVPMYDIDKEDYIQDSAYTDKHLITSMEPDAPEKEEDHHPKAYYTAAVDAEMYSGKECRILC